jgi:hypothetical protein
MGWRVAKEFRNPVPGIVTQAFGATALGTGENEFSNAVIVIGNAKSGVRNVAVGKQVMLNGKEGSGRDGENVHTESAEDVRRITFVIGGDPFVLFACAFE